MTVKERVLGTPALQAKIIKRSYCGEYHIELRALYAIAAEHLKGAESGDVESERDDGNILNMILAYLQQGEQDYETAEADGSDEKEAHKLGEADNTRVSDKTNVMGEDHEMEEGGSDLE